MSLHAKMIIFFSPYSSYDLQVVLTCVDPVFSHEHREGPRPVE